MDSLEGNCISQPYIKMKEVWTRESEVFLIEKIKLIPMLWDHRNPTYAKKGMRKAYYNRIADRIREEFPELANITGEHVRLKFGNLRTYFIREYRRLKAASEDSGEKTVPRWELYECISFLIETLDPSAASPGAKPTYADNTRQGEHLTELPSPNIARQHLPKLELLSPEAVQQQQQQEYRADDSCGEPMNNVNCMLSDDIESKGISSTLGALVDATVRKFTPDQQLEAAFKVMEVLRDIYKKGS